MAALRAAARDTLTEAGRAAASLALGPEAERYFEQAAELAEDDLERADLYEQAGRALLQSGDERSAVERLRSAIETAQRGGRPSGGSAAVALGYALRSRGEVDAAREVLEAFLGASDASVSEVVRAEAQAELAAVAIFAGSLTEGGSLLEAALETLEVQRAWAPLTNALITRAAYLLYVHRHEEALAVLRHAITLADTHDLPGVALRGRYNMGAILAEDDRLSETYEAVQQGLALARERGDRFWERRFIAGQLPALVPLGRWQEAVTVANVVLVGSFDAHESFAAQAIAPVALARADEALLARCQAVVAHVSDSTYVEQRLAAEIVVARIALERGEYGDALAQSRGLIDEVGTTAEAIEEAYAISVEAAMGLDDADAVSDLIGFVSGLAPARATPLLRANCARLRAHQAQGRGDHEAARRFEQEAIVLLRGLGTRPLLAHALAERGARTGDPDSLREAQQIYSELGASLWLARLSDSVSSVQAEA